MSTSDKYFSEAEYQAEQSSLIRLEKRTNALKEKLTARLEASGVYVGLENISLSDLEKLEEDMADGEVVLSVVEEAEEVNVTEWDRDENGDKIYSGGDDESIEEDEDDKKNQDAGKAILIAGVGLGTCLLEVPPAAAAVYAGTVAIYGGYVVYNYMQNVDVNAISNSVSEKCDELIDGMDRLFSKQNGKGERGLTGKPDGTNNRDKHLLPKHPKTKETKPGKVWDKYKEVWRAKPEDYSK